METMDSITANFETNFAKATNDNVKSDLFFDYISKVDQIREKCFDKLKELDKTTPEYQFYKSEEDKAYSVLGNFYKEASRKLVEVQANIDSIVDAVSQDGQIKRRKDNQG